MFRRLPVPSPQALEGLIQTISQRIGSCLEREGLLGRDIDNSYLQLEPPDESALLAWRTYRRVMSRAR